MGVKVVLVGSSGGGGATEGHADVQGFVKTLETQLEAAGMELVGVQMIATMNGIGMDHAGPTTPAVLHTRLHGERGLQNFAGSLEEVNERARSVDSVLASYIADAVSKCDAVVSMSADVEGANLRALILVPVRDEIVAWIQGQHHPIVGAIAGVLMCRGSKSGYYHSIALPIILIEMEHGDFSFVGSLDLLTLVCVSGGICAGVRLQRKSALAERGLWVNMCFGDMIEAAYPFMEEVTAVNAAGYLGSAVGGAILQTGEGDAVLSTAYMPVPLSILFAGVSGRLVLAAACLAAWGIPFIVALVFYRNR
ncbi:Hypothetical Protein FCC1311_049662 [Hondaea fermentalgiana]|uniref:Uncharacterized protein n=1 Tax=Hondaea fermentalgiana TaxID=2315210 RepID=A0A2R5GDV2_9STRA|nr:Hypothetical Protein FCC1311_049662 [Hondaea fermentalgiana]|eukprot:GBG28745.1 Hypothetical Protein FCC1311_049662 [Hondaea fermentalgiana]